MGNTHHAPSENRSTKSADGRMATEAARLERKESTGSKEKKKKKRKTHLTHTGLLMEGTWRRIMISLHSILSDSRSKTLMPLSCVPSPRL
jgi:hypothetical protein